MRRPLFLNVCLRIPLAAALFSSFDGNELLEDASDGLFWEFREQYNVDVPPSREVGATNLTAGRFESIQEPLHNNDNFHGTLAGDESGSGSRVNHPLWHVGSTGSTDLGTLDSTEFFSLPTISYHAEEYFSQPETGETLNNSPTSLHKVVPIIYHWRAELALYSTIIISRPQVTTTLT